MLLFYNYLYFLKIFFVINKPNCQNKEVNVPDRLHNADMHISKETQPFPRCKLQAINETLIKGMTLLCCLL